MVIYAAASYLYAFLFTDGIEKKKKPQRVRTA